MPEEPAGPDDEAQQVAEAMAFLELHGIPASAREFRIRQEFFRHGWDVRVVDQGAVWSVRAVKPGRPNVEAQGTTEGSVLRRALTDAIGFDESTEPS